MHDTHLTRLSQNLKAVLGSGSLWKVGDESGFILRERTVTAERFVGSLLKSLGSQKLESLADLVRDFNGDHNLQVHYKPYYNKLDTPCFPRMMKAIFESMLSTLYLPVLSPLKTGPFAEFRDLLVQDGSSFALHDGLQKQFPGRFTTVSPAAVELHCTMSLLSDNLVTVVMTGDSECERHHLPDAGELKGCLIFADRGYDSTQYMQAVADQDGAFLIRLRKSLNPKVLTIHRRGQRYRELEGKRLRTVLNRLPKGKKFDLDICNEDARGNQRCFFRLVISWNTANKEWMRLITNLDRIKFTAKALIQAYRLRWQIELLFKELKSYANLHKFSTIKESIAEGLIWASLCTAFMKRYIAHACQLVSGVAISTRRTAMCGHIIISRVIESLKRPVGKIAESLSCIFDFLCHNAKRAGHAREKATGRLALGLRLAGVTS